METTKHHIFFPRVAWSGTQSHLNLRTNPSFMVQLRPMYHNDGVEALHTHLDGVPLLPGYMALSLGRLARKECHPDEPIENIAVAVDCLEDLTKRARDIVDSDIAYKVSAHLLKQEVYIIRSLEHGREMLVPQEHELDIFVRGL